MSYEVGYVDGLQGTWVAEPIPVSNAPIAPYNTAPTGGFAYQAPVSWQPAVGSPTAVLDNALDAQTYTTPTGAKAWRPTASEDALVDAVTRNPYSGLDELVEAGGRGAAGVGIENLPYVGDVIGGAVDGALAYGATGSVTHGVLAGAGSTAGGIGGTAIGGAIGAVGGPVGIAVGGLVGGAVGSAFGNAAGLALANLLNPLPSANKNGSEVPGDYPYTDEDNSGQLFQIYWQYKYEGGEWTNGEWVGVSDVYPYRVEANDSTGCPNGSSNRLYAMGTRGLASGCGAQVRNIRMSPWPTVTDKPLKPVTPEVPKAPTISLPRIPSVPGFRLPTPISPTLPTGRPNPTDRPTITPTTDPFGNPRPTPTPTPTPIGYPIGAPGLPSMPDFGQPGTQPTSKPHDDPYPDTDKPNPNPTEPTPEEPGDCDPCKGIQQIKDKLEDIFSQQFQGSISLFPCEDGSPNTLIANDVGLAGLSAQITILSQAVTEVWEKVKCGNDADLALPESWAIKTARTTGQYVITWKPTDNSRSRWSSTIPHPRFTSRSAAFAAISNITFNRGDVMLNVQNTDNTQCIFNVKDETEADRLTNWVLPLMDAEYSETANPKVTKGMKARIRDAEVWIASIKYFSQGQADLVPDWIIRFDNNGNKLNE